MTHNRPEIVLINKKTNECHLVAVACPVDSGICVVTESLTTDLKVYGKNEKQIDTPVQAARVVSADMRMEVGIAKYVMLVMKRGNVVQCYGIPVT